VKAAAKTLESLQTLNLYHYSYYDPGWHEYEPTQSEVLTDLQRERRRSAAARGWFRLMLRAPWPLQVIPAFVVRVSAPVIAIAMLFAFLSAWAGVPPAPGVGRGITRTAPLVPLSVEVRGPITVSNTWVEHNRPPIWLLDVWWEMTGRIVVVNSTGDDLLVTVGVANEEEAGVRAGYPLQPRLIPAGSTGHLAIFICRTRPVDLKPQPLIVVLSVAD
jgi:hypothetical protein